MNRSAISATGGEIRAEFVPDANMVCSSLTTGATERLGQRKGLDAYASQGSTMGIPLLYPWANRLAGREFTVAGRPVRLPADPALIHQDGDGNPLHGLTPSLMRWRARRVGEHLTAELSWTEPQLLSLFPFAHELRLKAELTPNTMTVTTTVIAAHGDRVPVSFGFHPYLLLAGAPREQWQVELPACRQLALDDRMLPTGERQTVPPGPVSLAERAFDDAYECSEPVSRFTATTGKRRITVEFLEGFGFAQVFSPAGADFICCEPMTAPTNAMISGDGLTVLEPGEEHRAGWRVSLSG
jgi:aldose 1-epimerase